LNRLRGELQTASGAAHRAEVGARVAAQLARLGQFDESRSIIQALRADFGDGRDGRVTVWIMVAEGLTHFYQDLSPLALDRLMRAQALGFALKYSPIIAFASAWKAHIEFELSNFDAMVNSLVSSMNHAASDDHDSLARVSMVICNSFLVCGCQSEADVWFFKGRNHAISNGDQASVEALLYNRAVFALSFLRVENCLGEEVRGEALARARIEMNSAINLHGLTRNSALANHLSLWAARLSLLEGKYQEAIERFANCKGQSPFANYNFSSDFIDLEMAYCQLRLGGAIGSAQMRGELVDSDFTNLDIDDQMIAAWIKWKISQIDERFGDAEKTLRNLTKLRADVISQRQSLADKLRRFTPQN
jgi:tetratricopeptide (TPR) repeat protein